MRIFYFDAAVHPDSSEVGWQMRGRDHFKPTSGQGVAHDLLEHFPDDGPALEHEFMALGAMLWLRGGWGWQHPQGFGAARTWDDSGAETLVELLAVSQFGASEDAPPPLTARTKRRAWRADHDGIMPLVQMHIPRYLDGCLRNYGRRSGDPEDDADDRRDLKAIHKAVPYAVGWVLRGMARAHRRYYGQNPYRVCTKLFDPVMHAADESLRDVDPTVCPAVLRVHVDNKRLSVGVWLNNPAEHRGWRCIE